MITIKESTNIFNQSYLSYDSILTCDVSDSKIIFQSDELNNFNNLSFRVELYFGNELIFTTNTDVLYIDTNSGISNVDLSKPIRKYLISKRGLNSINSTIQAKLYKNRQINSTGIIKIYELDDYQDVNEYTFYTNIYKIYEKNKLKNILILANDTHDERDDLFFNNYVSRYYSPLTNINDIDNGSINNNVYNNSELLFNFYLKSSSDDYFIDFFGKDEFGGNVELIIKSKWSSGTISNFYLNINNDKHKLRIYPPFILEYKIYIDGGTIADDDFDELSTLLLTHKVKWNKIRFYPQINNKVVHRNFIFNETCKEYINHLTWLNTIGGYDTFPFELIHTETIQVEDKSYYKNGYILTDEINNNIFKESNQSYYRNYNKKYTFKTNWLTDDQIYLLEDLFKSNEIYYLRPGFEYVAMKNLTKKQVLYHKQIKGLKKYEITIEESQKNIII